MFGFFCNCRATGLSSHAIARRFGHCPAGRADHPWDPADLVRCVDYVQAMGIKAYDLLDRMSRVSPEWAHLVARWPELTSLLDEERAEGTGVAPRTYARMTELIGQAESARKVWAEATR